MDLSAYREIQKKNITAERLKRDLEYAENVDKLGLKAPNKIPTPLPVRVEQSNNTPSAFAQTGNALDIAKQVIAKQQPTRQMGIGFNQPQPLPVNPNKKVPQTLPYNPAALKKAQDKGFINGVIARSKTPEELRQYNLANIKRVGDETAYNTTEKLQNFFEKERQPDSVVGANAWAGLGQFNKAAAQTADFILPDVITPKKLQRGLDYYKNTADAQAQHAAKVNEKKGVPQWAGEMIQGTVAAVPNAILAMLSGGTSLGAQTIGQTSSGLIGSIGTAVKELAKNPMFYSSMMQTAGPAYEEAKANGATEMEATITAIISTIVNSTIEIGGGIETIAKNPISIKNWVKGMLDEGKEEVLQGLISQAAAKATYDKDKEWASLTDENAILNPQRMAQEFAGGAAVGGVLGGGQMAIGALTGAIPVEEDSYLPERGENATAAEMAGALEMNDPFAQRLKSRTETPRISAEDFVNTASPVWHNVDYADKETQANITNELSQKMREEGKTVTITEDDLASLDQYFPDLRSLKKKERLPLMKQSIADLKKYLRGVLSSYKDSSIDFTVNGNILEARLYNTGIDEVLEKVTQDKAAMLEKSREIFDKSEYLYSTQDKAGDPNIYRWNYFYVPLDVGGEQVGVRIAVRDMARQNESQVYNWGIKKGTNTAIDGGANSASPSATSVVPTDTIAEEQEAVKPALPYNPNAKQPQQLPPGPNASFSSNTVGAAQPNVGSYANLQTQYGVVDPGENPARMIDMPKKDAQGRTNSLFARTVAESEHMPDEMVEEWEEAVARGDFSHSVATDKAAISSAERKLSQGWDKAMSSWQEVVNGEKVATKNDIALGELLLANAMKDGDTATAMQLTAELCAEATRAGQAVQAMRLLKKMTPQGQLYYLQKMVNNLNEDFRGRRNFNGITIDEGLADNLVKATTREEMDAAVKAIRKNVAEQTPVTWQDRWNAWRYLSMLGNPTTHFRNILGNALFAPVVFTKNRVGQVIESAFKNTPYLPYATKAVVNKNTAEGRALLDFAAADYDNAAPEIQGVGKYSEKDQVLSERQVLPGIIGKAADFNTKALDAEDVFFSKLRYRNSLASYLKANNITVEQAKADPKVLDQARRYAIKEAQKATYRDASYVASMLNKAKRNLAKTANNTQNSVGKRFGARTLEIGLEGALPFTKTPINILKRGIEYSPARFLKTLFYDLWQVRNGNMTAAEAIDGIAAGLTGSALVALGWFMSSMGWVTGGPDEDDRRNRYESMLGRQDYSLNFGGSTYTIDWLAPESLPFFVGVSLHEDRGDDATFVERLLGTLSTIAEPMIEMSMLQGINSTLESIKYSQGVPVADVVGSLATSYAGQGVPTVFGKIARSFDPTSRQTYYDPNKTGVVKAADVFRQKVQAKSPWEGSLQPRVDLWGRTEQNPGRNFAERFAYNMLSPGYAEQKKTTEVDKELLKLAEATGETKVFPDAADKTFKLPASDGGETVKLNAEEYTQYAKDKGQKSYDIFDSIIGTKTWNSLSNEERVEVAGKVYEYANAVAKSNVSDYTLQDTVAKIQKCEKAGIPAGVAIVAYCAQKDVKGDKDSKGNTIHLSASKNKKEAIDRMTPLITKKQRELLYELFEVSEKVW